MTKKKVTLCCEICRSKNYVKVKSQMNERLIIKKFCRKCNIQTMHKEEK